MSSFLFGFGLNGLIFSLGLAALATAVQMTGKRPLLAHLLWLLVLVKLLTPSFVVVPGLALPSLGFAQPISAPFGVVPGLEGFPTEAELAAESAWASSAAIDPARFADLEEQSTGLLGSSEHFWTTALAWIWLAGSVTVFLCSIVRMLRFQFALRRAAAPPSAAVQHLADQLGQSFGLRSMPRILMVDAQVSPLVWWIGGRPQLVIPAALCQDGKANELRWSLAHELGHIRRGDHMVRWLEWLAVVGFWWNPVAWWARRNLRINEEICCDRLVLATLQPNPKTYANSLLNVVEFLATPGLRTPAVASAMNSGDAMETRLKMILKNPNPSSTPRWMRAMSLAAAVALLPLGFVQGQEPERGSHDRAEATVQEPGAEISQQQYDAIAKRLQALVVAGEITLHDASQRLESLRARIAVEEEASTEHEPTKQPSAREQYARLEGELAVLIEAGRISEAEAKARLEKFRRSMPEHAESTELRSVTVEEYKRAAAQVEALVEAGRLSRTQADERLIAMRRMLDSDQEPEQAKRTREAYAKRVDQLNAQVKAGRISHKEALKVLEDLQRRMEEADLGGEQAIRRGIRVEDYKRAALETQKAVEAGVLTPEQAKVRLSELQKRIVDNPEATDRSEAVRRTREEHYKRVVAELDHLVKSKQITAEQARVRLDALKKQMAKSEADEARAKAMSQEAEIQRLLQAGTITPEQAELRLNAIRKRTAPEDGFGMTWNFLVSTTDGGHVITSENPDRVSVVDVPLAELADYQITAEKYLQIEAAINAALAAERISKEDAEARKIAFRKMIRDK